jgi:hypothetical protein
MKLGSWLDAYAKNVFSQTGEDGIIEKILETIGSNDKWCVEFGAWDGEHLSNTCNLIRNRDFAAVLIEADSQKYRELQQKYCGNNSVFPVNAFVGFSGKSILDEILKPTSIPLDFDVLSIDIDGNDYHVWKAVSLYQPKVICIEYNPTIPTEVEFVQKPDQGIAQGASLLSLIQLGKEKGYELVAITALNAIFVHNKYFPQMNIGNNSPFQLRTDFSSVTYLFTGYDGTTMISGKGNLPWHGIDYREKRLQQLPHFLRKYPGNYNFLERALFNLFCSLRRRNLI